MIAHQVSIGPVYVDFATSPAVAFVQWHATCSCGDHKTFARLRLAEHWATRVHHPTHQETRPQ